MAVHSLLNPLRTTWRFVRTRIHTAAGQIRRYVCLAIADVDRRRFEARGLEPESSRRQQLLLVAHADDELIFAPRLLTSHRPKGEQLLVVCATVSSVRRLLIFRLAGVLHRRTKFICLYCRDSSDGFSLEDEIVLFNFLSRREGVFSAIFTHNPDGDYGHPQHRKIAQIASSMLPLSQLNFFSDYRPERPSNAGEQMTSQRPAHRFLRFLYGQTVPKPQRTSFFQHFEFASGESITATEWFASRPIGRSNIG